MNLDSPPPELVLLAAAIKTCKPNAEDTLIRDAAFVAYERWFLLAPVRPASSDNVFMEMLRDALNYIRREERRAKKHSPLDGVEETLATGDDEFSSFAEHDGLERFLAMLPMGIREIAEVHYLDRVSYEALSKKYGVAADTLDRRVLRAFAKLRGELPEIERETWGGQQTRIPKKRTKTKVAQIISKK